MLLSYGPCAWNKTADDDDDDKTSISDRHFFSNITTDIDKIIMNKRITCLIRARKLSLNTNVSNNQRNYLCIDRSIHRSIDR